MSTAPNDQQVAEELAKLKDLAPRIRQKSAFGNSNRDQIDAQIAILEGTPLSSYEVDETDEDLDESELDEQREIYNAANDAYEWLTKGKLCDGDTLSESWLPLVEGS